MEIETLDSTEEDTTDQEFYPAVAYETGEPVPTWKAKEVLRRPYVAHSDYKPGTRVVSVEKKEYVIVLDGSLRRNGDWRVGKKKAIALGLRKKKFDERH